jgi:hypothetical protein
MEGVGVLATGFSAEEKAMSSQTHILPPCFFLCSIISIRDVKGNKMHLTIGMLFCL